MKVKLLTNGCFESCQHLHFPLIVESPDIHISGGPELTLISLPRKVLKEMGANMSLFNGPKLSWFLGLEAEIISEG